jgi:hypothetical protein
VTAAAGAAPAKAVEPEGDPLPENEEALWLGRFWVFLPQLLLVVLAYLTAESIFSTRYLSFTTLGAAVLLAYYATRERSREARLAVAAVLGLALLVAGYWPEWSAGVGLFSSPRGRDVAVNLQKSMDKSWKPGDVLLMRSGLWEADLLRTAVPAENRAAVERAALAPLTTLYPDSTSRPVVLLPLSAYRSKQAREYAGAACRDDLDAYYDEAFAAQLRRYQRYWMTGLAPTPTYNSPRYLACFLPYLADTRGRDVSIARDRGNPGDPERYVIVPHHLPEDLVAELLQDPTLPDPFALYLFDHTGDRDDIKGLTSDYKLSDFPFFVHLARPVEPK